MSEDRHIYTIQLKLRGALRGSVVRVTACVNFIYYAAVATCMTFSLLAAVSTDAAELQTVGATNATKSPAKTSVIKPDPSCDAPAAIKNSKAVKNIPHNHDRSCLVALTAIDKLRAQKDFSFVDVRSPAEYDRFRIADSINIPLHLVKTKGFLKNLSVVLVNDGRSTTELEKTCGELKQAGFDRVAVLDGGLFAWYVSKRPLAGDPLEQSKLNRTTAPELFEERAMPDWSVIDVSTPGKYKDMRSWLPAKIITIPLKAKGDSIARISSNISQQRKRNPQGKLLLIADNNDAYQQIDAKLQKSGVISSVLRLDGGFKGYREHVTKQLALWTKQKQPRRYEACRG